MVARAAARGPALLQLDGESVEEALARLAADPGVEYAEPNLYVRAAWTTPSDPMYSWQWGMDRVSAPLAWDSKAQLKGGAKVCIVDTGVDCAHPDLAGNCAAGANMVAAGVSYFGLGAAVDNHGHGTAVAGVVGASGNNGAGVAGVAWRPSIYACKFMDRTGVGTTFGALRCLDWCIAQGTAVSVNAWGVEMSALAPGSEVWASTNALRERLLRTPSEAWSGGVAAGVPPAPLGVLQRPRQAAASMVSEPPPPPPTLPAGHLFVAPAGNAGQELSDDPASDFLFYPAMFRGVPNLLVVTASNAADALVRYPLPPRKPASSYVDEADLDGDRAAPGSANWGPTYVEIAAPGEYIVTTAPQSGAGGLASEFFVFVFGGVAPVPTLAGTRAPLEPGASSDPAPALPLPRPLRPRPTGYQNVSGTSIASAFAGGAAVLLLSAAGGSFGRDAGSFRDAAELKAAILKGADAIPALAPHVAGGVSRLCLLPLPLLQEAAAAGGLLL